MQADIAVVGLAVMGQNLVLNLARNGFGVVGYNRSLSRVDDLLARAKEMSLSVLGANSLEEMLAQLKKPRIVLLMVQAGGPVDAVLDQLVPMLDKGDIVLDGGNSFFKDTQRRTVALEEKGLLYMGVGVSGGEEGALNGPSIMPGGSQAAWQAVEPLLKAISAHVDGESCCEFIGFRMFLPVFWYAPQPFL